MDTVKQTPQQELRSHTVGPHLGDPPRIMCTAIEVSNKLDDLREEIFGLDGALAPILGSYEPWDKPSLPDTTCELAAILYSIEAKVGEIRAITRHIHNRIQL